MDFENLTLGEIEEMELLLGTSIDTAFSDGKPKGRALRVFYYMARRRENPEYKFEDTEKVTQAEALSALGGSDPKGSS